MSVQRTASTPTAPVIITIDGPAGVGKSTLARSLAQALSPELGVAFLDTGAMFRAVAFFLEEATGENSLVDAGVLAERLKSFDLNLQFNLLGSGDASVLLCNGRALGSEIRSERIGAFASRLATFGKVRDFLREAQQKIGAQRSLVAEGRDMGTIVFPAACCKFFLDAKPEVRALRRRQQLLEQNADKPGQALPDVPGLDIITEQIRQRDAQDRGRAIAPLRPAEDAVIVDTSNLTLAEVLESLLSYVWKRF
jgi:cytidylate kinase